MHLHLIPSRIVRRFAGRCIATVLVASSITGGLCAHAEPATTTPTYAVAMAFEAGGEKSAPRVLTKAGEQFAVASGNWRVEMTVRQGTMPTDVWLVGKVFKGSTVVGAPTLMVHINEQALIKVGESSDPFSLAMVVSPQP